jgi:hypothetical protein
MAQQAINPLNGRLAAGPNLNRVAQNLDDAHNRMVLSVNACLHHFVYAILTRLDSPGDPKSKMCYLF